VNHRLHTLLLSGWVFAVGLTQGSMAADDYQLDRFHRLVLTDTYYSEGIGAGDLNGDGQPDVVHGPYWFAAPDYDTPREIYPAKAQPRQAYADNFFSWVYDFNGDGLGDILVVGFPGTPGYVYENPGPAGWNKPWPKHQILDSVANESPQFVNIVGDERPELVCTQRGHYGFARIPDEKPFDAWEFEKVSDPIAPNPFGHGLGIGDIDGDGRQDILCKNGWYQQPDELGGNWAFSPAAFSGPGGAEMYAYDVDGDGDQDVITSLAAHEFGLAWHEQVENNGQRQFVQHLIMGNKPSDNEYGLVFTELHSVNLADIDGDGLKDIVTGKTYWSHHTQSPMWDAGAVVYWFKLQRDADGVHWIPMLAEEDSGIGRQLAIQDINGDGLLDMLVGGMKGASVLIHERETVDEATYKASLPQPPKPLADGLEPQAAAEHMTVPAGFQLTLAAGEPKVHQPIAMTIDGRGRIWVAEAYTYPRRAPEGEGKDKIIILEDQDLDGDFETRKVFAEGLNLVSGMEVGFGGVWVGAAPYLMFIPDADGDDVPDGEPQILLDGFGYHDTHETLNGFNWGPDGWLYGCHGVFTHSKVGKPGTPDAQRTPLNAGVWRYHPIEHRFEVFAWGSSNPWGVDFNDYGDAFITACVIPHLYHIIPGGRYQRQAGQHFNPHVYDDIKTIADHAHYVGNIQDHAWWGHEPLAPQDTLAAGGGHAHCGAMVYLGDNWPASYRGQIYMNNVHGNRVNCDILEPYGSGYVGRHGKDTVIANDRWYRGINLRCGPDGTVYIIDWYDENACHRTNPEIWDRTNGRVYNLSYGTPKRRTVDLEATSDLELAQFQTHANDWYCRTARRILQHRASQRELDADAVTFLNQLLNHDEATRQLRAIWTLHACGILDEATLTRLASSEHSPVRRWAVRVATADQVVSAEQLAQMVELAAAEDAAVRLEVASSLQHLPTDQRWAIAEQLVQHDEDQEDHNLPLMIWYGIEPLVEVDTARALKLARQCKIPQVTSFIYRRAASDDRLLEPVIETVVAAAKKQDWDQAGAILSAMTQAFEGRVNIPMPKAWEPCYEQLVASQQPMISEQADRLAVYFGDKRIFPRMRTRLGDSELGITDRRQALEILVRGQDKKATEALHQALEQPELRRETIRALSALGNAKTGGILVSMYRDLDPESRQDVVNTLVSRPESALQLLDAIDDGKIARTDLHAYQVRQLTGFNNAELTDRIRESWGEIRSTPADRLEKIAAYKKLLTGPRMASASASHGRMIFQKTCSNCHRLFGEGGEVGPDITGSNRANLDYVLENVIDPSAVLGKDYRMTVIETDDGRLVQGLIKRETDSGLTLQTLNDVVVINKAEIIDRELSELSMMPEGLLDPLSEQDILDLVKYLGSPAQVVMQGPEPPIDAETGKVPGAIEGESMKIVGKTAGNARNQDMKGFAADRWSGNDHLWWTGGAPGDELKLEFEVEKTGTYTVEAVLTMARDYGIVELSIDDHVLGSAVDAYNDPEVINTGVQSFDGIELKSGTHQLGITIKGANPAAVKGYMMGLDYIRLVPQKDN
jgi:putative membrane-bound dehydrogenase-like protein